MDQAQDPQRSFLQFGNPFRMLLPKKSSLSPKMLDLLNTFEENLSGRLKKFKPAGKDDVVCLAWMRSAVELLCGIHADIKVLITALELPVCDWDEKWIDVYLSNSVTLLDICIAFSSEISRLKQSHLFLQCALYDLTSSSSNQFMSARTSLDEWRQHIGSKNPRLHTIFSVMDILAQTLEVPKVKNSAKGKVLMQAMYGVKVVTLFVCSAFAAAFSGSAKKLMDLQVPETCLWAEAFGDIQAFVNTEMRNMDSNRVNTLLKELDAVETGVQKLYPIVHNGANNPVETEALQNTKSDLEKSAGKLCEGLNLLAKEVDSFFKVVLTGRDALLSNLRLVDDVSDQVRNTNVNAQGQAVR